MRITDLSLKRPIAVTVLIVATVFTGIFALTRLDVNYLPNISYPMVKIHVWWRGATADDIETNIADPLEEVIATVDGLDYLESSCIEGMYTLLVNFSYDVPVEVAFQDVVAAMGRVTKNLPRDIDPPVVIKADPSQLPVIEVMLTSDRHDLVWLREWAENWLVDRLATVKGTAGAEIVGGMKREIRIHLDPERLQAYKLSADRIAKALYDENNEMFAGRVTVESREIIARTMGEFDDIEEIRDVVVALDANQNKIYIRDIATVEDSHEEMRIQTYFQGKPCIEFKVLKQYAANAVTVADGIKQRLSEMQRDGVMPEGISFGFVEDESEYVTGAISSVESSAIISAILVIIVVYLFLGRWRQVVVMLLALPITLLANFALMRAFNFSINVFSLGGLVVALGVILDNSIVVMENITRRKSEGDHDFALQGTREVGSAIVASTLTFLAIFLPFVFVPGMSAVLFKELVLVVAGVVVISLLVAITLTPLLTDRLLRGEKQAEASGLAARFDRIIEAGISRYQSILDFAIRFKIPVIFLAFILLGVGLGLGFISGSQFLPKLDDGRVMVKLKMPSGASVEETNRILGKVENAVKNLPEVASVFRLSGGRVFGLYTLEVSNEGNLDIQLVPKSRRNISTGDFIKKIRPVIAKIQSGEPGAKIPVKARPIKGLRKVGEQDIEVNIKGSDVVALYEFAEKLADKMSLTPGFSGVNISMDMTKPEYRINIDRAKASAMNISVSQVANVMRTLVQGKVSTLFREGSEYYPVRVMVPEINLSNKNDLENLIIETRNGEPVYIRDIATIQRGVGPVEISREDQIMRVIVRADAAGISVGEGIQKAYDIALELKPPPGVEVSMGSEARFMQESRNVMTLIIGFAALFAFVILAVQFESLLLPLLIMINIPLTMTGVFSALFVTGKLLDVTVQIGVLVMMGGITSQGVVLLSTAEQYRQQGMNALEAIRKASPLRIRPILMTQLTTVLGLLPLAFNIGEGGDMLVAMAIAVIGGLIYSLFLTLIFLPAAYALIYKNKQIHVK
jgi:hydrophobe/amphiphile efflux-1 (HAE1) family protein